MAAGKALIVWGGWDGHTPKESGELAAAMLRAEGFAVELSDTVAVYGDTAKLAGLSLVVPVWTGGTLTPEQEKGLTEAVKAGVGLAGFHGGIIDSFRNHTEYQWMTGGQWVAHPGGGVPAYKVAIVDRQHPITRGVADFELHNTEQYYMHVDPGNHVLATTKFDGGHGDTTLYPAGTVMPYAWTRNWGKGRVFVAAWGHTYKDFDVPEAREILRRGMLWAARPGQG
jgi:type 1 glutamine amidotransferase